MIVSHLTGQDLIARYVCADCWGVLVAHIADNGLEVHCVDCGQGDGFVTMKTTQKMIAENRIHYILARTALKEAVPWMFPKSQPPEELMRELGYQEKT